MTWGVKMLNCIGLSVIILQCDPEPSLIKWAENVKSRRQERTVIQSSPRRSHQSNGSVKNYQKQLQGHVRTMLTALQDRTQYRPTTGSALMKWIVRQAAWLMPCFKGHDVQSPFYRAMGGPHRGQFQELGEPVLARLPVVGKGSAIPASKLANRRNSAVWLGKSDLTDEHVVTTDEGVVYARSVTRAAVETRAEAEVDDSGDPTCEQLTSRNFHMDQPEVPDDEADIPTAAESRTRGRRRNAGSATGHKRETRSAELRQRREAHRNTREYICEETSDDEITEAAGDTCLTS